LNRKKIFGKGKQDAQVNSARDGKKGGGVIQRLKNLFRPAESLPKVPSELNIRHSNSPPASPIEFTRVKKNSHNEDGTYTPLKAASEHKAHAWDSKKLHGYNPRHR
jgi:hypothetical protein